MSQEELNHRLELIAEDTRCLETIQEELNVRLENTRTPILRASILNSQVKKMENSDSTPNRSELQLLIQAIPEFHPGQSLSVFINEIDNLLRHLNRRLTPDLTYILNVNIRSKIKGDARDFISYQNAVEWFDIRKVLLQKYGDQRSEELLVSDLTQCVQQKTEKYMDFYSRLLKAYNSLMQNVTLNIQDPNYLAFKKLEYDKLALKTFQIGLLEPYRSFLGNFEFKTIEECINKCHTLENRNQEWDYCEFLRNSQNGQAFKKPSTMPSLPNFSFSSQKPPAVVTNLPHNTVFSNPKPIAAAPIPRPSNPPNFQFNQPKFFQQHQNFPRPSLPFQQRNQTFSPPQPKPIFGPQGSAFIKNLPPPEPMSVQSRVRSFQGPIRNNFHHRKPYSNLHNVESLESPDESQEHDPNNEYHYTDFDEYYYQEGFYNDESSEQPLAENEDFRLEASNKQSI